MGRREPPSHRLESACLSLARAWYVPGAEIHGAERQIGKVFSDEYSFEIPMYQRQYSWTIEQAGEMLEDLLVAQAGDGDLSGIDPYFLGSLVLVKDEHNPRADVVDGQQRLTTLTILLAVLRSLAADATSKSLHKRIFQEGDALSGALDQPRLRLRAQDRPFFEKYVQREGGTATLLSSPPHEMTEPQRNIHANAAHFHRRLQSLGTDALDRLARYIDQKTYLVVVSTPEFDSAYRVFAVLNERGLDLSHSDILKSEVVGEIPEGDQKAYAMKWEAAEELLERDGFTALFAHLRMIFAKAKLRETVLKEFRSYVLPRFPDRRRLVDEVIIPYTDAYEDVVRQTYTAPAGAEAVNRTLRWLNRLDNFDWIPPAIWFRKNHAGDAAQLSAFLVNLERLAASMFIRRVDITRRIERYGRVLAALEKGKDPSAADSPLQLTQSEKEETLARLDGDIYNTARTRVYILLRLDEVISGGTHDYPVITVEHVLPQFPAPGSIWREWFTDLERMHWQHRLANLVLLTRRKNASASNYDFAEKKTKYFSMGIGGNPFFLTTTVLDRVDWKPQYLEERQRELVGALAGLWGL